MHLLRPASSRRAHVLSELIKSSWFLPTRSSAETEGLLSLQMSTKCENLGGVWNGTIGCWAQVLNMRLFQIYKCWLQLSYRDNAMTCLEDISAFFKWGTFRQIYRMREPVFNRFLLNHSKTHLQNISCLIWGWQAIVNWQRYFFLLEFQRRIHTCIPDFFW